MIASLKDTILFGENVSGVSVPDGKGVLVASNLRLRGAALRNSLPSITVTATTQKLLTRSGNFSGYVTHTGTAIAVYDMQNQVQASLADTTENARLALTAFENGVFISEKTSGRLLWFDGTTLTEVTDNGKFIGNFRQRFLFTHPGTWLDEVLSACGVTLSALGETDLPLGTEISSKSARTVVWGGIVSDFLGVLDHPSSLLADVELMEIELNEVSYTLYKCVAGAVHVTAGSIDLYRYNGSTITLFREGDEEELAVFSPEETAWFGHIAEVDFPVWRSHLGDFLSARDWGYTVLPGGHDITGLWCTANDVIVSTAAALWRLVPLPTEPTFSVSKIADFGALALGGTNEYTVVVGNDGKVHSIADGKLGTLRQDDLSAYTHISVDELSRELFLCDGSSTKWYSEDVWTTLTGVIYDAHNGMLCGKISNGNWVTLSTDVLRLGEHAVKTVRTVRVLGTNVQYVTVWYKTEENGVWRKGERLLLDNTGLALVSASGYEFKLVFEGSSGAVVHDILLDYEVSAKSNILRTRRI
ncbi:MAG: hypothetical protein BWY63_00268 [Chloroflexi bacterium ADurb.Bin360]|nr:MAG: hypothetical protein BWY63_00268 [Chloroflexi bacterium ADurb.Bin360]